MFMKRFLGSLASVAIAALVLGATSQSFAQNNNNNRQVAGVEIDAAGVLRIKTATDPTGAQMRQHQAAARAKLGAQVMRVSESRKISLNRLEAALADRLAKGQGVSDEMRYLVGLTRVRHVFYYPETKDIVIEGPAEGFAPDLTGRVVGVASGHSILELQDLIVALRSYPATGGGVKTISVSIDPTAEGLARMQQFLRTLGVVQPSDANRIAAGLRESLGEQVVSIRGVSPQTHFAQVLVEADYRMKLIGIGLEAPAVKIDSYVSRANPKDVARNAMERWYFTPNYECVKVSPDKLAMELVGEGVKLIGENERVTAEGGRQASGSTNRASQAFVQQFTAKYAELAKKSPVYAQLRNLIDLSVVAAYIQEQDFYGQSGWKAELFGNEQAVPVETYQVPKHVDSAVNVVWKGATLMTPIGGGVNIQPKQALSPGNLTTDNGGELVGLREKLGVEKLDAKQWWWD